MDIIYPFIDFMIYQISEKSCIKKQTYSILFKPIYSNIFDQNSIIHINIPDTHYGKYCPSMLPKSDNFFASLTYIYSL